MRQLSSIKKLYRFTEKRGAMGKGNTQLKKREKRKEKKMKKKMKQKANKIKGQTPDVTNCVKVCTISFRRFIIENACLCGERAFSVATQTLLSSYIVWI